MRYSIAWSVSFSYHFIHDLKKLARVKIIFKIFNIEYLNNFLPFIIMVALGVDVEIRLCF
jgi:hypothetical protein